MNLDIPPPLGKTGYASEESGLKNSVFRLPLHVPFRIFVRSKRQIMIVCIAEKPSVARDIAEVLGARNRKEGYIEGNGYQVTWTFGHLCTLKEPHEYTPSWKTWSLGSLPMIPPRFGIKLINDPGIEKQFHIIESLMSKADLIINCGDAGQEGELIQRWVMQRPEPNVR